MKSIIHAPNPILTAPAQPITAFDANLKRLINEMKVVLLAKKNPKGVGLAAPQIGYAWRIFVTRPNEKADIRVFINPKVTAYSDEYQTSDEKKLEGCLSIPGVWGDVKRAEWILLHFLNEKGRPREEKFTGFFAVIIQHETDHINGILFTERVLKQNGKLYQASKDKAGREVLEEITIGQLVS